MKNYKKTILVCTIAFIRTIVSLIEDVQVLLIGLGMVLL